MNDYCVSIVVPIYKVENYLPYCIDSLINQTYSNLEIILVDDGSPDKCPRICDGYAEKDHRIKVVHKKNGGLSDARNIGVQLATGDYITFVDSDDYVDPQFIERLVKASIENDADISVVDYVKVGEESKNMIEHGESLEYIFSGMEFLKKLYRPTMHGMEFVTWGKLFRLEFFRNTNIQFPIGKLHEDTFTTYKLVFLAKTIVFSTFEGYYYRVREDSIMTEKFNLRHLDQLEATSEACTYFLNKRQKQLYKLALNNHVKSCFRIYLKIVSTFGEKSVERVQFEKKYMDAVLKQLIKSNLCFIKKIIYLFAIKAKNIEVISKLI